MNSDVISLKLDIHSHGVYEMGVRKKKILSNLQIEEEVCNLQSSPLGKKD